MSDAPVCEIDFRLTEGANSLLMKLTRETDRLVPSFGDARLVTDVQSNRFSGAGVCWVDKSQLDEFTNLVTRLEQGDRVAASLESMSPGDFSLLIEPVGSRGYFSVQGQIGRIITAGENRFQHSVRYGFSIEWAQITELAMSLDCLTLVEE